MLGRLLWRLALQGDILSGVNQVSAIIAKQQPASRGGNDQEKYETDELSISRGHMGEDTQNVCVCVCRVGHHVCGFVLYSVGLH